MLRLLFSFAMVTFGLFVHSDPQLEQSFKDFAKSHELKGKEKTLALNSVAKNLEVVLKKKNLRNAMLHYNLGTVYLHLENYGKSIYHLKMAHEIDPNDSRIANNLMKAGQVARVDLVQNETQQFSSILQKYWKNIGPKTWQGTLIFLSWVCAIWYFFSGKKKGVLIFSLSLLLTCLVLSEMRASGFGIMKEVVLLEAYNPRNGLSEKYPGILKDDLKPGASAILLREQSGWVELLISNEYRGWVPQKQVGLIQ